MAKLYFKYGAMGSSKTATALITKYNYEERGMRVWLIKPAADSRDGEFTLRSRVGLTAEAEAIGPDKDIRALYARREAVDVIIVDECQFMTGKQIDELRELVDREDLPVLCFGLRTDFQTKLFPGSRRLFELADSITEIKTICDCGRKATVNARLSPEGYVVTEGSQVFLGGNDSYIAMCHKCYQDYIKGHRKVEFLHGNERDSE
ncbi:MAG: thymidine kinase [Clostridiales bacterium]|nr:thymidine kinase [Clostridiales bacterium]